MTLDSPRELARRSRSSFDDVYGAELQSVVRLAALLVRSQAVAEELAHDAFVRLYERFDEVENPPGFLRTAVVRLALSWQRREGLERRRLSQIGVDRPTEIPEIDETWDALGRLSPEAQTVLVLRFYEQLRHREIAALLDCPTSTIRSRTRRALQALRKELAR